MNETLPTLLRWPGWLESHAGCCARRLFLVPDLDWTVEAGGYRLVIENGAMVGLAYDEFPWPWGDPRYDAATRGSWMADGPFAGCVAVEPAEWETRPVTEPPPDLPYKYFGMCDE